MIKALATGKDGRPVVILGLSKGNMDLLLQNKPIQIDLQKDLGVTGGGIIIILGGATEAVIQASLEQTGLLLPAKA